MRVLLGDRDAEDGAIAVVVALLAVILVGMSAFVADFGMAYANKRQLQTAADAAVFGAGSVFAAVPDRTCGAMLGAGAANAQAEATSKVAANKPPTAPATLQAYSATCTADGLQVTATVTGTSPNLFGGILGRSGDYDLQRSAATIVEAAQQGRGLRPLGVCSAEMPATLAVGDAWRIFAPGGGHVTPPGCPVPSNPGSWWTLDCPGEGVDDGNGTAALEDQIRNGCSLPVSIVAGQGTASGAALNTILANACPGASTAAPYQCLSGDPGQPDSGQLPSAWQQLIDLGTTFPIPIFCAPSTCATSSVVGTGTNAIFPVHRLVSVNVCGYHFGSQPSRRYAPTPTGSCTTISSALQALLTDNSSDVYLLVTYRSMQVSGNTGATTCRLGDPCDGGLRQVRMIAGPFTY